MKVKSDGSDFDFTIVTLLNQTMNKKHFTNNTTLIHWIEVYLYTQYNTSHDFLDH